MKRLTISLLFMSCLVLSAQAQNGGLSAEMLKTIKQSYVPGAVERALHNAVAGTDIRKLATNAQNEARFNADFSDRVKTKGITDQKSSGRCWLFSGLNVLRAQAIEQHDLKELTLSPNYLFFYDQLEKSNLFLQGIIDTRSRPLDDRQVEWLLKNPIGDGGTYTGVADLIAKYGIVPQEVMPENYVSNNTARISNLLSLKLREFAMELRDLPANEEASKIQSRKIKMLGTIYRMLAIGLGEPVQTFAWTRKNSKGDIVDTRQYTPMSFYNEYFGNKLIDNYVMVMNVPSREYYKVYEIDFDRHLYDGHNWLYINLPIDDIKQMAVKSIKANKAMYFSCDVGKFANNKLGTLDLDNYDYEALMGVKFGMDKKQRIETFASGSSHAMTLIGVDLDQDGKVKKWLLENSWGASSGHNGTLIMTDRWFEEYMFRLVVEKQFIPEKILKVLKQKPIQLPPWDPMFAMEE